MTTSVSLNRIPMNQLNSPSYATLDTLSRQLQLLLSPSHPYLLQTFSILLTKEVTPEMHVVETDSIFTSSLGSEENGLICYGRGRRLLKLVRVLSINVSGSKKPSS